MRRESCFRFALVLCAVAMNVSVRADESAATPADLDFFEKRVQPLLVQRCFECHSAKAEKLKGGLLLDSREAILNGGDSGPAAVVGDVEKSLIVQAIRYDNENVQMSTAGKLPEAEVTVLTEWVRRGFPFPATNATKAIRRVIDVAEGKKHWAFRPLECGVSAPLSLVVRSENKRRLEAIQSGAETPHSNGRIDDLILFGTATTMICRRRRRHSKGTLIRRLSFNLLGLPPTSRKPLNEFHRR